MLQRQLNTVRTGPHGGTPVVLVHPVGLDLTYWDHQIEALSAHFDVLAFDLPGHGRSPGVAEDWSFDHAAAWLWHVIQASGMPRAHVVGLSVGGMIAQQLALTTPSCVRSLTLIGTAASFPEASRAAMRERARVVRAEGMTAIIEATMQRWFAASTAKRRPDLLDRATKTLLGNDPRVHAAMWDMIAAFDVVSALPRIQCPTLVLVGETDPSTPPASARAMQAAIPAAALHVISDASHLLPFERPDEVNRFLLPFLAAVASEP